MICIDKYSNNMENVEPQKVATVQMPVTEYKEIISYVNFLLGFLFGIMFVLSCLIIIALKPLVDKQDSEVLTYIWYVSFPCLFILNAIGYKINRVR